MEPAHFDADDSENITIICCETRLVGPNASGPAFCPVCERRWAVYLTIREIKD